MTTADHYPNGYAAQALDQQIERDRMDGFAVLSGCSVSLDGSNDAVVQSGEILWNGTVVSVAQQTVALTASDTHPRRDVIHISDNSGTASASEGEYHAKESAVSDPSSVWQFYKPSPNSLDATDSVVLAECWIGTDDQTTRDRRLSANYHINNLNAAGDVSADGDVSAENVSANSGVSADTVTATGAIEGDSVDAANGVSAGSVDATGDVNGDTLTADTSMSAPAATIATGVGIGVPASSSDPGLAFDTWRQPSADRPTLVHIEATAETGGSAAGEVDVAVDEDGGTTADYNLRVTDAPVVGGSTAVFTDSTAFLLPAGAQYQVINQNDPATGNSIDSIREFDL